MRIRGLEPDLAPSWVVITRTIRRRGHCYPRLVHLIPLPRHLPPCKTPWFNKASTFSFKTPAQFITPRSAVRMRVRVPVLRGLVPGPCPAILTARPAESSTRCTGAPFGARSMWIRGFVPVTYEEYPAVLLQLLHLLIQPASSLVIKCSPHGIPQ